MTGFALTLVLLAAVLHAAWNLAAKRAGGGLPFVYLTSLIINALYLPVVIGYWLWRRPELPWGVLGVIAVSALLKTAYSLSLQRGYRLGDFSLIYPLARGTGPFLSMVLAVALLGERPTWHGFAGGLLIVGGIFFLTGGTKLWAADRAHLRTGIRYGLLAGVCIATYTLWDRHGVAGWRIPPVLFDAGTAFFMMILLTPFAWVRRAEVAREWREHRREAFTMAVLSPIGYVLVLTALTFTPVSYVAPAREISILIGTFWGARLLKEKETPQRLSAAAAMVAGIVLLAAG